MLPSIINNNSHQQKEPYIVQVVGVDQDIEVFRNFISPFSTIHSTNTNLSSPNARQQQHHNHNNNISIISVRRKMNKNTIVREVRYILSNPNNNNNNQHDQSNGGGNLQVRSPGGSSNFYNNNNNSHHLPPVQAYLVLCDSTDDDSLSRAGDLAQTVAEPRVPLVICDVNTSTENMQECSDARNDLTMQMYTLPEFCQTVALAAWSLDETQLMQHRHWSAEEHAVDLLCTACVEAVTYPKHLLWDGASSLSSQARQAIRRSFWMLDRDGDDALSDVELCGFTQAIYERVATQDDINEVKYFIEEIIQRQVDEGRDYEETRRKFLQAPAHSKKKDVMDLALRECYITIVGFFAICHFMVSESRHTMVWKLLHSHGIQPSNDCKPFLDDEIERAIEAPLISANMNNNGRGDGDSDDDEDSGNNKNKDGKILVNGIYRNQFSAHRHQQTYSLHLSEVGAAFFASLYKKVTHLHQQQNSTSSFNAASSTSDEKSSNNNLSSDFDPTSLFMFTPACPWKTVYGLPNGEETKMSVTEFVNCWKFMTQVDPATVAMFAKYWDFDGLVSQVEAAVLNNNSNGGVTDSIKSSTSSLTNNNTKSIVSRDLSSLFVARKMRRFRTPKSEYAADVAVPPSASFLVLGSGGCGKTTLMQHLSNPVLARQRQLQQIAHTPGRSVALVPVHLVNHMKKISSNATNATSEDVIITSSSSNDVANNNNINVRFQQEILVSLRELEDMEIDDVLADTAVMDTMDGVILCYDGNDPYSFGFIAAILPKLAKRENLPIAVVMCKGDLEIEDQLGLRHSPEELLRTVYGLPWPPTGASVVSSTAPPNKPLPRGLNNIKNDIDNLPTILAELVLHPELSTITYNSDADSKINGSNGNNATRGDEIKKTSSSVVIKNPRKRNAHIAKQQRSKMIKRTLMTAALGTACFYFGYYLDHKYNWTEKYVPVALRTTLIAAKEAIPTPIRRGIVGSARKVRDTIDAVVRDLMMMNKEDE